MFPVIYSSVPLSFWGGIDPGTGLVIDQNHPLVGTCVTGCVLCLPGGRGSSTGSQTMLELILNGTGPEILVLQRPDVILCTGAIVAQEFFQTKLSSQYPNMRIPRILGPAPSNPSSSSYDEYTIWKLLLQTQSLESSSISFPAYHAFIQQDSKSTDDLDLNGFENMVTLNMVDSLDTNSNRPTTHSFHFMDLLVQVPFSKHNNKSSRLQLTSQEQHLLQMADSYQHTLLQQNIPKTSSSRSDPTISMAQAMAMKTLFRIAQLTDATSFIPITRAHIDACIYIGKGGLEFAQTLVRLNGRVAVPSTTNASSVDRQKWQILGTPSSQLVGQAACQLQDAYIKLDCLPSFSCTPYLPIKSKNKNYPPPPQSGEQMAWGESNAVVFANSILGARTEKYADYMDICAALVGRVPDIGVHRDDQRLPDMIIDVRHIIQRHVRPHSTFIIGPTLKMDKGIDALYPVLGWLCGNIARDRIPLILGMELLLEKEKDDDETVSTVPWYDSSKEHESKDCMWLTSKKQLLSLDDMKGFSAAFGTTATVPLFHIANITPEARDAKQIKYMKDHLAQVHGNRLKDPMNTVIVSSKDLLGAFESLNHDIESSAVVENNSERIDLVALGNPNFSSTELETLYEKFYDYLDRPVVPVTITLSRDVYEYGRDVGMVNVLEQKGFKFISDTCWCMLLDGPVLPARRDGIILTNSGKYAHYGGALTNRKLRFGSLSSCLHAMRTGFYPKSARPDWLPKVARFCTWARKIF